MSTKSIGAFVALVSLCGLVGIGRAESPATLESSWSKARFVVGLELQRGSGVMQVRLSGPKLKWDADDEPQIDDAVLAGCGGANKAPSAPLEIELAGDAEEVVAMTDLAMDAFMANLMVEVKIELARCSNNDRYVIRDIRAL